MTTFHHFSLLPWELRSQIWQLALEPRTVEVRFDKVEGKVICATSSTPVPRILHACHEARSLDLYDRAFTYGKQPRYIWVNFDLDMISIGDNNTNLEEIIHEKPYIRHLRMERENDGWFCNIEAEELVKFTSLENVHVVSVASPECWTGSWEYINWKCPRENVRFIEKETGWVADGFILDRMWRDKFVL